MSKLGPTQIDQLREIGAYLRQVRQDQGANLEEIANRIFIRPTLLRAIEEANDDHLPEPVFVQGFIRRYAEALGVNGQDLSQRFSVAPVSSLSIAAPTQSSQPAAISVAEPALETRQKLHVVPTSRTRSESRSSLLVFAIASAVLLTMVGLLVWAFRSNRVPSISRTTAPEPTAESEPIPLPEATSDPTTEPARDPLSESEETAIVAASEIDAPVVASINLTDRAWMSVTVDGEKVFEGILESGAEETWNAQESIVLTSGNAGGVNLSLNGNTPVPMGEAGRVRTLTLTPTTDPANFNSTP